MSILYRVRQFWHDIKPLPLTAIEQAHIEAQLSPAEVALFKQYAIGDQRHAYQVMAMLKEQGHNDAHLLTAALLHDIGKSRFTLSVWDRVWPVLVKKVAPSFFHRWGNAEANGWKRPFVIIKQHPVWGAEMAEAVGAHPTVINLIRRHQDNLRKVSAQEDELLAQLQWADNQN